MTTYTVHEPPPRREEITIDPDRFVLVRDGFYFWAFVFGPLWMLWRRLWLVLILYAVVQTAVQAGLWALGVSSAAKYTVGVLIALLVGLEAATLRRWTLTRRGWTNVGVVVAPNLEAAEHRFFHAYLADRRTQPITASVPSPTTPPRMPSTAPEVIGLFPQPEPRR